MIILQMSFQSTVTERLWKPLKLIDWQTLLNTGLLNQGQSKSKVTNDHVSHLKSVQLRIVYSFFASL